MFLALFEFPWNEYQGLFDSTVPSCERITAGASVLDQGTLDQLTTSMNTFQEECETFGIDLQNAADSLLAGDTPKKGGGGDRPNVSIVTMLCIFIAGSALWLV